MALNPIGGRAAPGQARFVVRSETSRAPVPGGNVEAGRSRRLFVLVLTLIAGSAIASAGASAMPARAARHHQRRHHNALHHNALHHNALHHNARRHHLQRHRRGHHTSQSQSHNHAQRSHRRLPLHLAEEHGAPTLWVSGTTLHWSATAVSHEYLESRTAGATTTYAVVTGTSDTPPAVAGATVAYRVRPRYQPRGWSNEVNVAYGRVKREHEGEESRRVREETRRERQEREAKERAEREALEKAEREAKEKAEREAKERAEREAKEVAEREAKEKAEREAKERAEREAKEKAEREAKEVAEREAKERAEREAKERAEREAREKAEREAKERAEREAREKAEREERERIEREHKGGEEAGGAVVGSAPVGPPAPASGWHVAYADGFGAPLGTGTGQDNTVEPQEHGSGCCSNSNEIAVEKKSEAKVSANGLELLCTAYPEGVTVEEGNKTLVTRKYSCSSVKTTNFFSFNYSGSGEWVAEIVAQMPPCPGGVDPAFWTNVSGTGGQEIDFYELFCWGTVEGSYAKHHGVMPDVVGSSSLGMSPSVEGFLGFNPELAEHRYTTLFQPTGSPNPFRISEYVDGVLKGSFTATIANASSGLKATNAMRESKDGIPWTGSRDYLVRSIAFYQEADKAGVGIKGGGIAPGTTVK